MASTIPNSDNSDNSAEIFANPANIFQNEESVKQVQVSEEQAPNHQQEQPKTKPTPKPSEPSICIPRAFKSTTRKDIFGVIEKLDLGPVDRIDLVAKTNERGESYNKVFIHFKIWNRNPQAQATRDKLLQGEEIKIVYNEPWFWKCTASRVEKPAFRDYTAPPPRIDLGGSQSLSKHDATKEDAKEE